MAKKRLHWKLNEFLDRKGLTRYQLMKVLGDGAGRTAYRWGKLPQRIDTGVLERVLQALEELTGDAVEVDDLLEFF